MPSAASHASRLARAAERIVLVLASSSYDLSNLKGIENVSILKSSVPTAAGAYVYPALALLAKRVGKLYAATVRCSKDVNEALHEAHALGITQLVLAPRHANSTANGEDTHDIVTWVDGGANSSTAQLVLAAVALGYKRVHIHTCNAGRSFATTLFEGANLQRLKAIGCGLVLSGFVKEINATSNKRTAADKYLTDGCRVSKGAATTNSVNVLRVFESHEGEDEDEGEGEGEDEDEGEGEGEDEGEGEGGDEDARCAGAPGAPTAAWTARASSAARPT